MDQALRTYLEQTESLYASIEEWLAPTGVTISREEVEMLEEAFGAYTAPAMTIKNGGGRAIARMQPVAARVLGGDGRIDLTGNHQQYILILLTEEGGPKVKGYLPSGTGRETVMTQAYRGVGEPGWYWIESIRRGRAYRVDRVLFFDLLSGASNYVFE